MRPADIESLVTPGRPALRGDLLLTAVSLPDLDGNATLSTLRAIGGNGDTAWTHGERDSSPAISPDGRWVAFLRVSGHAARPQIHVIPAGGGDARQVTWLPLGADEPVWAPDSRHLAFTARVPEPGRYGVALAEGEEAPEADAEAPRRITRYDYRIDNTGFLRDRPSRLFVIDTVTEGREPEPLTDAAADVSHPVWTPDGTRVVVVAPRDWDAVETLNTDLYSVPATGGAPELVVRTRGTAVRPVIAADGAIFYYGSEFEGLHEVARNSGLWTAEPGTSSPRRLTDTETVDCAEAAGPPAVRGDDVLVVVRTRGAAQLRAVPRTATGAKLDTLTLLSGEKAAVRGFAVDGERVALAQAGPADAGEILLLAGDTTTRLTDFGAAIRGKGVLPAEELTATAPDGYPVHGWLVLPEGEGPHPVLLVVHGGPFAAYEWSLFDEAQVYAAAGYAVVLGNPRGSAGYGQAHGRAIIGGFGTVDADDLLALLDAAVERSDVDGTRAGVMGGSYGGFMTSWLAAHHGHRFTAAWSERAVNAFDSFEGSSDIGWYFGVDYVGTDPAGQRDRSPLTYAHRITIPFAVVHSEQDWRCPLEQAQRMFVALKKNGTETELLLFPGEGHELSRSGKPRHRVQRFEAVLDWWRRHLPVNRP
ncbi:dipeptidyl aminopeptidase [Prauserella marina]|uniref:Dipeptidyl aminopeptidase/acylaminoacyl peptidase n=1 Tax=Prauserella marina TaxID=530584 RepID=A0A222VT88_9PSEU|nr:S9 family peptidase [Prauserella marina]ASR37146.1 dipeptidyl aminopeptidase [Prauserella marina]PWV72453.1 dipeptidyl aminopeptidase/acylaminoacyl peptidase [Prauserella marina]SDD79715.1 Dipeptidyl aminopeptidase/acylaminoacyl peptidase [Prauserella marina]